MVKKTDSFQLKAEFLPITTLRLLQHETALLEAQLQNTIQKAPQYFANAPIILDFSALKNVDDQLDVKQICTLLRQWKIQPIAARGLKNQDMLPMLPEVSQKAAVVTKTKSDENSDKEPTKMITKPVRAGTQIYAKDGDLIIMSSVNAGAEVIADGNIHIYGPLRGRALAGAQGNVNARIFCKELEAELISIAGRYWVSEKIKTLPVKNAFVQIYLENDELKFAVI